MIGVALFLAPWIIVRAAFIGVVHGNPSLSAASPAVMQRVRRGRRPRLQL